MAKSGCDMGCRAAAVNLQHGQWQQLWQLPDPDSELPRLSRRGWSSRQSVHRLPEERVARIAQCCRTLSVCSSFDSIAAPQPVMFGCWPAQLAHLVLSSESAPDACGVRPQLTERLGGFCANTSASRRKRPRSAPARGFRSRRGNATHTRVSSHWPACSRRLRAANS